MQYIDEFSWIVTKEKCNDGNLKKQSNEMLSLCDMCNYLLNCVIEAVEHCLRYLQIIWTAITHFEIYESDVQ